MADLNPDAMDLSPRAASHDATGNLAEALPAMNHINRDMSSLPSDPDAQATVTDFLDFTEYLPSDIIRSLTLIRDLDSTYIDASSRVHELTTTYGQLPRLAAGSRPDIVALRADISESLSDAVSARTLSHAEACRMQENIERHYNRARNILAKLKVMAENFPSSRETSPAPRPSTSPQASRAPKITLRLDQTAQDHARRVHRPRVPRITVPGEVLAPFELDYESYGTASEDWSTDDDDLLSPQPTPATGNRIKLIKPKTPKLKTPKLPRPPRTPGMGTNAHSAVAGISTANALAKLKPPPVDAVIGSEDAPWLQLTAWELAKLRKRMKKNAVWNPSDTMIARELKTLGRGIEAYRDAKLKAEAMGEPLPTAPAVDPASGKQSVEGAINPDALGEEEIQLSNRGMKLNEAKKLKKENQAKEQARERELANQSKEPAPTPAKEPAKEAKEAPRDPSKELPKDAAKPASNNVVDASARKLVEAARAMKGLFEPTQAQSQSQSQSEHSRTPSKPPRKRKRRDSSVAAESDKLERPDFGEKPRTDGAEKDNVDKSEKDKANKPEKPETDGAAKTGAKPAKRPKMETPVPVPQIVSSSATSASHSVGSSSQKSDLSPTQPLAAASTGSPTAILPPATTISPQSPPKKSITPILPPGMDKRDAARDRKEQEPEPDKEEEQTPGEGMELDQQQPDDIAELDAKAELDKDQDKDSKKAAAAPAPRRQTSVAAIPMSEQTRRPSSRGAAPSTEPLPSRSRRASTVQLAPIAPAAEPQPIRPPRQRGRRPAPGPVTENIEGSPAVSVGKRRAAPRKKAGKKVPKDEGERWEEVDDEGNTIDPNEPRYCVCNRCEKEWFHLECVGLTDSPPRTTKWYCPDCRVTLGIGDKGEISARGKKK